jgi:hypothetical protein
VCSRRPIRLGQSRSRDGCTGPLLALKQRQRFRRGTVLIVDGTPVTTRDRIIAHLHNLARRA